MSSKRLQTASKSIGSKKRKTSQSSMMNFFGTPSNPIDLTASPSGPRSQSDTDGSKKNGTNDGTNDGTGDSTTTQRVKKFSIYCDLDGVLADFESGVKKLNGGRGADGLQPARLWSIVGRADNFYLGLPWMKDGKKLWSTLVSAGYVPDILTGVPMKKVYKGQKFQWCRRELQFPFRERIGNGNANVIMNHLDYACPKRGRKHNLIAGSKRSGNNVVNVITCWSANKHCESRPGRVLIDDRAKLGKEWTAKGGIFIHHTDTESSIQKMIEKGILPEDILAAEKGISKQPQSQPQPQPQTAAEDRIKLGTDRRESSGSTMARSSNTSSTSENESEYDVMKVQVQATMNTSVACKNDEVICID